MSSNVDFGERIDTDNKHYQLYQKGVELGTWDAEKLIEKVPAEKDKEMWESMSEEQQNQWARLVTAFMDGEHEVAQDGSRLIQMVESPYLDNTAEKAMFYADLSLEEAKHTQFCTWYAEEVVPDHIIPSTGNGDRYGDGRNPHFVGSEGFENLFDRQAELLEKASRDDAGPIDIARATANYNCHVEGVIARGGYFIKNRWNKTTPMPAWNQGFQFISTDEGRHITAGTEILKELVGKEKEGKEAYQGVQEAVWDQLLTDQRDIYDATIYFVDDPGAPENPDPLNADLDKVLSRFTNIYHDMYVESIGLETFDSAEFARNAGEAVEECQQKIKDGVYKERIQARMDEMDAFDSPRATATDGGQGE